MTVRHGQHRPQDLAAIAQSLISDNLDYCIGYRDSNGYEEQSRRLGKRILRLIVRFAAGQPVKDFNSGLRGFRRDLILRYLHLLPDGSGASTMTTLIMIERHHIGCVFPSLCVNGSVRVRWCPSRDGFRTMMIVLRIVLLFKPLQFFGGLAHF